MKEELSAEVKRDMSDMKKELSAEVKRDMFGMKEELGSELKKDIEYIIKEQIENSESFLLDEMERYYLMANKDIQELKIKVDRIDRYYSSRRVEDDERNLKLEHLQAEVMCMKERLAI